MICDTELPNIDAVAAEMTRLRLQSHPAGAHGALCGLVCAQGHRATFAAWLSSLAAEQGESVTFEPDEATRLKEHSPLGQMYWVVVQQLQDPEYTFDLLLPDASRSMAERCEALAAWCGGFLFGLGSAGGLDLDEVSPEVKEVLEDVMEISRFSIEDVQGGEEEERAFAELEQYLRVAVLLIWAERRPREPQESSSPSVH